MKPLSSLLIAFLKAMLWIAVALEAVLRVVVALWIALVVALPVVLWAGAMIVLEEVSIRLGNDKVIPRKPRKK